MDWSQKELEVEVELRFRKGPGVNGESAQRRNSPGRTVNKRHVPNKITITSLDFRSRLFGSTVLVRWLFFRQLNIVPVPLYTPLLSEIELVNTLFI
jgi:hypothetical protein